jgi:hypothetical protein
MATKKAAEIVVTTTGLQVSPGPEQAHAQQAAVDVLGEVRALLGPSGSIYDADTYAAAGRLYLAAREARDRVWARFSELIDPLNLVRNQLLEARRVACDPADKAIEITKRGIDRFDDDVRREREAAVQRAREAAAAEEKRLREEAARAALAERERLHQEQAAAIAKAKAEGDKAKAKMLAKAPIPEVAPAPVAPVFPQYGPETVAEAPDVKGLSKRVKWAFTVTNAAAVKREFCAPDEKAIRKVVEAMGERAVAVVGGIEVRQETSLVRR